MYDNETKKKKAQQIHILIGRIHHLPHPWKPPRVAIHVFFNGGVESFDSTWKWLILYTYL